MCVRVSACMCTLVRACVRARGRRKDATGGCNTCWWRAHLPAPALLRQWKHHTTPPAPRTLISPSVQVEKSVAAASCGHTRAAARVGLWVQEAPCRGRKHAFQQEARGQGGAWERLCSSGHWRVAKKVQPITGLSISITGIACSPFGPCNNLPDLRRTGFAVAGRLPAPHTLSPGACRCPSAALPGWAAAASARLPRQAQSGACLP